MDVGSGEVEPAIRVGWLTDPNVHARQIGTFQQLLVAAPSWRERFEPVRQPEEVHRLPFVTNTALRDPRHWHFTSDTARPQSITVQPVIALMQRWSSAKPCAWRGDCLSCPTTPLPTISRPVGC